MAASPNVNLILGELMNNPLFWVLIIVLVFFGAGLHFGWFSKIKLPKKFKEEDLNESLMKDLRPRMKTIGKKIKNNVLMQNKINLGKVRRISESQVEIHTRTENPNPNPNDKGNSTSKLEKQTIKMVYLTVGGNFWLSWIPYIGKNYDPDYFVMENEHIEFEPQSKIYTINKDVHIYPYAGVWVGSVKSQRYLTELEARRTQEFEAQTNINTLKRWTHYHEPLSGRVVIMEKDTQLEQDRWDHTVQKHDE